MELKHQESGGSLSTFQAMRGSWDSSLQMQEDSVTVGKGTSNSWSSSSSVYLPFTVCQALCSVFYKGDTIFITTMWNMVDTKMSPKDVHVLIPQIYE